MLVLSVKVGKSVQIGSCDLTVLEIDGNKVKLGMTAPIDIDIARAELLGDQPTDETLELLEA